MLFLFFACNLFDLSNIDLSSKQGIIMDDRLLFLMSRALNQLKQHIKRESARAGLAVSPTQMGILFSLKKIGGLPMTGLGRLVAVDNAAVTRHVERLLQAGFVRREAAPGDRRKNIIQITEKGKDEAARCAAVAHRINDAIKEGFTQEEVEAFKKILNSFFTKFSE
jgi:DNA-binding MarR family transcriptional regulator